ncbi:diablo IAP-binding mitochondrial protein-like [Antennarius striatus]|uniref:diablo IAP-binding mitochondrial protein-like n=1 Tax=Antennarius striatus TaxID=241820 RepID=UPI0035B1408B
MAAPRRLLACLKVLRSSVRPLVSSRKPPVHKPAKWTSVLYTSVASLTGGASLCAIPFREAESLSHDTLIRRAVSLATDSSSTLLSQTTLALIDAIMDYSKAVHTLIALQKRYLESLGKLSPVEEDKIWQVIISQRAQVKHHQDECHRFESSWIGAVKLCETAAEVAFSSGADHASVTVRTNIQLALSQVEEAQKLSEDANKKLTEAKVMEVERMTQYATTLQSNDEEDVPEAYLRED